MSTQRKVKTLRLTDQDIAIIERLKQHYGITSENEAIRMALRSADRELNAISSERRDGKGAEQ